VISKLKTENRQLQSDMKQLKAEWCSPSDFNALQSQLKELQSSTKQLRDEVNRKREVISQMKAQKEQTEQEAN